MSKPQLIFEYGTEGGSAEVFQNRDGSVYETGSSRGIMDEAEDPVRRWREDFKNWDEFWQRFTAQQHWYKLYVLCIHPSLQPAIGEFIESKRLLLEADPGWKEIYSRSWERGINVK